MKSDYIVVIGGMNVDIAGLSGNNYQEKDSNIGEVSINVGGVGQNIARNLTKMEADTYLVTVYGEDSFSEMIQTNCQENHVNLAYAESINNSHSSMYLYINDGQGDLVTAVNDMAILENITPEFLNKRKTFINQAKLLVVDCNLPASSIKWLAENITVPLFVDPVSVAKAGKILPILDSIDTLKPNELEAEFLTGIKIVDVKSAVQSANCLIQRGVKNVFISMGAQGILCANKENHVLVKPLDKPLISTNGAGDCSMATIAWTRFYYGDHVSLEETGKLTQVAASITMESSEAVSPELNVKNILKRYQEVY